jgi:hypothetical protein
MPMELLLPTNTVEVGGIYTDSCCATDARRQKNKNNIVIQVFRSYDIHLLQNGRHCTVVQCQPCIV